LTVSKISTAKGKNQGENMIKKVLATVVAASMQPRTLIGGVLAAGAMVLANLGR